MAEHKYHPSEIDSVLRSLAVIVDTREQDTLRARKRLNSIGLPVIRQKLDYGDYSGQMIDKQGDVISLENIAVIERKMNLDELAACFCHGRERFKREFERAKQGGAKVYLIVENDSIDKLYEHDYRSKMSPKSLIMSLIAWCIDFQIVPYFVSAKNSGKLIHDILYREAKNYLETMEV